MRLMRRQVALTALALALTLALAPLGAVGQAPPGPTTRHQLRVEGLPAPGPMELVTFVLEFPPGSQTPPHTHPGLVVGMVLEGELTFQMQGGERVYRVGDTVIELPNEVAVARNSAAGRTRVTVSMVVPPGAPPSAPQPGGPSPAPPTPTTHYLNRTAAVIPAGPYEVAQAVLDFAPGAWTAPHTHPGQTVVTVLEGTVTRRGDGTEAVYRTGETWVEPGVVHQAGNDTGARASVMATFLVPKGAPLTTVAAAAPGLPNTGAGGSPGRPLLVWLLALVAGGLLTGAWAGGCLSRRAR